MSKPLRILLVEDSLVDAELLELELARAGFPFELTRVENEADYLREIALAPDVILCDYNLPQFGPLQALNHLRDRPEQIPVIVVSGSIGEERAVDLLRRGVSDVLIKDRLGRLGAAVSQVLEQRRLQQVERSAQQRLLQKEEQYHELADSMPHLVWTMNEAGQYLYFNQQCVSYTGLGVQELSLGGWTAAIHPHDQLTQVGHDEGARLRIRHASGAYRWHLLLRVAQTESEAEIRWVGTCTDIHDQVVTEGTLRVERDRFARIASVAPGVIHTYHLALDGTGSFAYLSPGAADLFGVADPHQLVHPDDLNELKRSVEYSAANLSPWQHEYRILHPIRGLRWLEARSNPLREPDGSTVWHGFMLDITERKNAEAELRMRDRAIQAVSQGILITRPDLPDNPIIFANPAVESITGYSKAEIIGKNCRFLQGQETDSEVVGTIRQAVAANAPCSVELLNYRKDGSSFWNALTIDHFKCPQKVGYSVGVVTDVTARRSLEAQYQQAQKMEAFGQLAGGIAHDFNNLLTVINGYSQIALEELAADDPVRESLWLVLEAGARAAALTSQLLAFSRKTIVKPHILNLNTVIGDVALMLERVIGEDIIVELKLEPNLPLVRADPGQLHQVIMNLAVNARDAMPLGGRLQIATDSHLDWVHLSVADTGCGMSEEVRSRIFEPFFTTKEPGKGTGLGLATVYGIAENCGGRLEVNSQLGVGSTFHVFLPGNPDGPETRSEASPTDQVRGCESVLLVEDNAALRGLLVRGLENYGYRVMAAANSEEALQIASGCEVTLDILVTDVVMPGSDGRVLGEQIQSLLPHIKILHMSGYNDDALLRRGIKEGRDNFLQKPFSIAELCQKMRDVLDVLPL